jgi:hypothetical protein
MFSRKESATMGEDRVVQLASQSRIEDPLSQLLREKAGELLHAALNAECEAFLERWGDRRDDQAGGRSCAMDTCRGARF